jgi:hypothetical protein
LTDAAAAREIPTVERRFWQGVYDAGPTPFDLGQATPALCDWLDGHPLDPGRALVPGCGRGHDVIELARRGFDALGVDFAGSALRDARALAAREEPATGRASIGRAPARFLERDLFSLLVDPDRQEPWEALPALEEGSIDLWWENTCYCAIERARRGEYARIAARLVRRGGTLLFLAFPLDGRPAKASAGSEPFSPPYPIRAEEIAPRFAPHFVLRTLAPPPRPSSRHRVGRELLAVLERV